VIDVTKHHNARGAHAHRTTSSHELRVTGRFTPSSVRPLDILIGIRLIQLKPTWSFPGVYSSPQLAARDAQNG